MLDGAQRTYVPVCMCSEEEYMHEERQLVVCLAQLCIPYIHSHSLQATTATEGGYATT